MYRLCYISTCRSEIDSALLASVLAASRRNNARLGITGLLVAGRNRFLQMLEGDERLVAALYDKIRADPRHFACVVLRTDHGDDRLFPDWAMGSVGPGSGSRSEVEAARALVERIDDISVRAEFDSFLDHHARAA